jgi:hypothetical protein
MRQRAYEGFQFSLQQADSACLIHGLRAIRGLQLPENVTQMLFDGFLADE